MMEPDGESSDRPEGGPVVHSVEFTGDTHFSSSELRRHIETERNRRFLRVPGLTWWRWVYDIGDSGLLGDRVGDVLKSSGEPPARLDTAQVERDADRLQLYYQYQGFRAARVESRIEPIGTGERVRVEFEIDAGAPTYIRTVTYEGLDQLGDEQKQRVGRESELTPREFNPDRPLQYTVEDERYRRSKLIDERQRLLSLLRDDGYARISRDSIRAVIRGGALDSVDVEFQVRTGARYRFGDVHFNIVGPESDAQPRTDTLDVPVETYRGYTPTVTARIEQERRLSTSLLRRALQFTPGEVYSRSDLLDTKRRLESTGVFAFTNIAPQVDLIRVPDGEALPADTTAPELAETSELEVEGETETGSPPEAASSDAPSAEPMLPHNFEARTQPRHRVRAETFLIQRREVFPGAEDELGIGAGVTYENANLLGGGESFQIRTTGSIASSFDPTFVTSAQAEVGVSLTNPYLIWPFGGLDGVFDLVGVRTRFSLGFLTASRSELGLNIRGRGNANLRLEMDHTPTLTSLVDVFDVSLSNPDTLSGFNENFLDRVIGDEDDPIITDPVQRGQVLEDYTQPQINSAFRYTLRSEDVNPLRRERGHSYEVAAEVGNTMPLLLDRFVFSPDTLRSSLGGVGGNDLIYRPYVRAVTDLRRYRQNDAGSVLAMKFIGGLAHPIGRPDIVPFDRRFFSGGASSVRGWSIRELGPGRASLEGAPTRGPEATNILGGDIKLEASIEWRSRIFRNVLSADWLGATFVDAGNVWFGPRNPGDPDGRFRLERFLSDIGVGTGVGVRADWEYLILRFDMAFRAHDPLPQNEGFFPDGLSQPQFHFGIGHAF